ncbi:putative FHA domain-containing protein [Rosellinia necatrix]|uniref:Putative FHA domain-containing protein n=1 Tax=Rosellinia necatrix TaxID=77044 RepID=A0A1S7UMA0_ROSNE|nr:putative FHA domain-containing protein [Rosellinia necatrix]
MTAVASPPAFSQHNRPTWGMNGMNGINGGHAGQIMNPDELNRALMPRKNLPRNNSSSSISSASSVSSTSTVATSASQPNGTPVPPPGDVGSWPNGTAAAAAQRKRPQPKAPWTNPKPDPQADFARMAAGRPQLMNGVNGSGPLHAAPSIVPSQGQVASQQAMSRPMAESLPTGNPPVLYLLSLNGTFERKTISVPFSPDTLRIGRQTNAKTVPTPVNGFFDSKVLSRQHAEIWADRQGKIWIRDVKSSNGTFVNGTRLSQENRESDPHELSTGDHLELGIDIVSEDQKTIVHHKVAAKVEHAGYFNAANNLLDVNFGDLDPANGPMMMMGPQNAVPLRQRSGSQSTIASNGRAAQGGGMMGPQVNAMAHQRGFFFSPITTEQIVKRLQNEMRNARLQSQDLARTDHFVHALLTKEDIKDIERPEVPELTKPISNGVLSFRSDNKTRFSDPPAPPPQQPLPEKPDIPSLKRGITERPKLHPQNMSPIRHEGNGSQILQLTEALNNAKKEIESQTLRMRDLEEMLHQERLARERAEDSARDAARQLEKRVEEATNAIASPPEILESVETSLDAVFEPPNDEHNTRESTDPPTADNDTTASPDAEVIEASATELHTRMESLVLQITNLRQELDDFKQRAKATEHENEVQRESLADMALQLRRSEEARERAEKKKLAQEATKVNNVELGDDDIAGPGRASRPSSPSENRRTSDHDHPASTQVIVPTQNTTPPEALPPSQLFANSIPYASMIGVVLLGVGLMAYINGWQPQPRLER